MQRIEYTDKIMFKACFIHSLTMLTYTSISFLIKSFVHDKTFQRIFLLCNTIEKLPHSIPCMFIDLKSKVKNECGTNKDYFHT